MMRVLQPRRNGPLNHRIIQSATCAAVILGTLAFASNCSPALAAYFPHGSYLATCRGVHIEGDELVAFCTRIDGRWHHTRIFVPACRGDISNYDGHLRCGE